MFLQLLVELVVVVVQALYQEDHGFLYFELVNQPLYPQELFTVAGEALGAVGALPIPIVTPAFAITLWSPP